jgi:hypothetical protein
VSGRVSADGGSANGALSLVAANGGWLQGETFFQMMVGDTDD